MRVAASRFYLYTSDGAPAESAGWYSIDQSVERAAQGIADQALSGLQQT